ncbi:FkbM family methyltransferase [Mucilaginibacter sp. L196]|uniref:FkbM family methyltransferase n=1 Tax=Mucilaginibacter sp. L196 TaxID=1641870 RepID=UPI00131E5AF9|nr:FkbM family methyltransferase [Mucilaginibacter sp. L196]
MKIVKLFHRSKTLRLIAKKIGRKINIRQKFHGGYIFLNAVEHSWAWTGERNYNNFDAELQDFIYKTSKGFDYFIDIGSNIGVMTIGVLLANNEIKAVAVDPNVAAIKLLKKSLTYNMFKQRCEVINAAIGITDGYVKFDETGSVTGHVSEFGKEIQSIKLSKVLNRYSDYKSFVKIDIEGFEAAVITDIADVENLSNKKFIIEMHPLGFNNVGNPVYVFEKIKQLGGKITDFEGKNIESINPEYVSQLIVTFP